MSVFKAVSVGLDLSDAGIVGGKPVKFILVWTLLVQNAGIIVVYHGEAKGRFGEHSSAMLAQLQISIL